MDAADDVKTLRETLMVVDLQVISNEDCENAERGEVNYKGWIYDNMMCTYTGDSDACQGDSGKTCMYRFETD